MLKGYGSVTRFYIRFKAITLTILKELGDRLKFSINIHGNQYVELSGTGRSTEIIIIIKFDLQK